MNYQHKNICRYFRYHLHRGSTVHRGCEYICRHKTEGIYISSHISCWAEYKPPCISFPSLFTLLHPLSPWLTHLEQRLLTYWISVSPSVQVYTPLLPVICYFLHFSSCLPLLFPYFHSPLLWQMSVASRAECMCVWRYGFVQGYLKCSLSPETQLDPPAWRTVSLITAPPCRQPAKLKGGGVFILVCLFARYFKRLPTDLSKIW